MAATQGQSKWTEWLRLNVRVASEAADARSGQDYQVLVRGHQPRAQDKPVQALQVPSIERAATAYEFDLRAE